MRSALNKALVDQRTRYLIAGGTSFVIEYTVYAALEITTRNLYLSNSLSFCMGLAISFLLHKYWSFSGNQSNKTHHQFAGYVALALINLMLSNVVIGLLVSLVAVAPLIAKVITMIMITIWNYLLFSKVIFKVNPKLNAE